MGSVGPFFIGTFIYIALGLGMMFISVALGRAGKNPHVALTMVLIPIAVICMWLLWAMAWLMQWHPIIVPIKATEE